MPTLPGSDTRDPLATKAHSVSIVQHALETKFEELKTQQENLLRENSALKEQFSTLKKSIQELRARVSGVSNNDNAILILEEIPVVEGIVVDSPDPKNIVKILQNNIHSLTRQVKVLETENSALKQRIKTIGELALELRAML